MIVSIAMVPYSDDGGSGHIMRHRSLNVSHHHTI